MTNDEFRNTYRFYLCSSNQISQQKKVNTMEKLRGLLKTLALVFNMKQSELDNVLATEDKSKIANAIRSCFKKITPEDVLAFTEQELLMLKALGFKTEEEKAKIEWKVIFTYDLAAIYGILSSDTLESNSEEAIKRADAFFKCNSKESLPLYAQRRQCVLNYLKLYGHNKVGFITITEEQIEYIEYKIELEAEIN